MIALSACVEARNSYIDIILSTEESEDWEDDGMVLF